MLRRSVVVGNSSGLAEAAVADCVTLSVPGLLSPALPVGRFPEVKLVLGINKLCISS